MVPLLALAVACQPDDPPPETRQPPTEPTGPYGSLPGFGTGPILINEIVSANETVLTDSDGDTVDWLELVNASEQPVDLSGFGLTDDEDDPHKWVFPPVELAPGELLLVYASDKGRDEPVASWDTRVDMGDDWRYRSISGPTDPDWVQPGFDDSGWAVGASGFGRADGDDATTIPDLTVYARTTFSLTPDELADVVAVTLHVDYDDAFVAYLNGVEVARANISGTPPAWDQLASEPHEAQIFQGGMPEAFELDASLDLLVEGDNVLAIEGHDHKVDSSDLSLVPFLSLGYGSKREGRASSVLAMGAAELHTSFELAAEGERLFVIDPLGKVSDGVQPGRLYADQAWGRQPDGGEVAGYFLEPTPGAPNTTEMRRGFAETPTFDPPPGRYVGGTQVTVAAHPDARVHYAWEGWEPTEDDPEVSGPLQTGDSGDAVVLRARAWQDGLWPSRIATATYVLREAGTLPVVSVVADPDDLWHPKTGIDVLGPDYDPEPPWEGANFYEDWERPVHVALWELDGSLGFAVDGMVKIHGNRSRTHDQRGLQIKLSSATGDPSIEHEVFPGLGITSFQRLLLRSAGNDWYGCFGDGCSKGAHLRDPLMQQIAEGEVDTMAYRPAEAYVNGQYWGIYNLREKFDEHWIASHFGYPEDEVDLLEGEARVVEGDSQHYLETLEFMRTHDLSNPANYEEVKARIDIDELAAYIALEIYYDNTDWPGNNIKFWRPRTPDGRWRWMMYDTDFGLGSWYGSPSADSLAFALDATQDAWPNPAWSTELFRLLLQSPEFTEHFINRYADYMNTILRPEAMRDALHTMADGIRPEIPRHIERWGVWTDGTTTYTMPDGRWETEVDWIDEWLGDRPAYARDHVVTNFGLAGTWTLTLEASPPDAGTFQLTAVEVEAPFEGTYFLGVPVTVTAVPAPGHTFAGWSDPTLPANATVTLDPSGPTTLHALFD